MNLISKLQAPAALATAVLLVNALPLHAQVAFNGTDAYTQNFDTLPNSGAFAFDNNSTLAGWYSTQANGQASRGAGSGADPIASGSRTYSWGATGSSERALGVFSNFGSGFTGRLGLQLQNTSGGVINALTLTFDVEEWRQNTTNTDLSFAWLTTTESGNQLTASDYTVDARGGLTEFVTGSAAGVNGNSSTYRQTVSFTLTGLDWQAGEYLWLRWTINQPSGSAVGIGLDNLSVAAIPEASTVSIALGVCGLLAVAIGRLRRR